MRNLTTLRITGHVNYTPVFELVSTLGSDSALETISISIALDREWYSDRGGDVQTSRVSWPYLTTSNSKWHFAVGRSSQEPHLLLVF